MSLPLISATSVDDASDKAAAYKSALRKRSDPEYEAAAEIYQLLSQGRVLVDVGVAIREGGFDERMRPRLAIARADRRQVYFSWGPYSDTATFNANAHEWRHNSPGLVEAVNFNRRHGQHEGGGDREVLGYALVPMIPADVRPEGQSRSWHILWEVEQWSDERIGARPPVDPYLLRRVRGDLFVVLAQWDLSDVERYVMAGRARIGG